MGGPGREGAVVGQVPSARVTAVNAAPLRPDGQWVLYWMIAARRPRSSFALDRALEHARALGRPLVVLEPLRAGYRWASARLHRFVLDGMADNARAFATAPVTYHPYVEPAPGAGAGLLEALAARACVVVTDEFPCFFLPRMVAAAGARLPVRLEQVDGNGLLPLRAAGRAFHRAVDLRRHLQRVLPDHLGRAPAEAPLAGLALPRLAALPAEVLRRWPAATDALLAPGADLSGLPIDHTVGPVETRGGHAAAAAALERFVGARLARYDEDRNEPDRAATSGLSPYLHFGHLSAHDAVRAVLDHEGWSPERLAPRATGQRAGWWGVGPAAEGFLDQVVTWRELGHVFCHARPDDYDRWEGLPDWARATLDEHRGDRRATVYPLARLEAAATHDPVWNAAQTELVRTGHMHNYLRMLWGKKVLEWSATPEAALEALIELNNKYALDGRDPNSYSGITWCFGRFDRAWGPERPIFGKIRYMSSDNTVRKLDLKAYLARWGRG